MSDTPYVSKVDRRTALIWLGAVGAATAAAGSANAGVVVQAAGPAGVVVKGYGTDPNLMNPVVPWPRTLSKDQLQACAYLCDYILPAEGKAPSASALGVPDFIDEWVSAPYPDQVRDRPVLMAGLAGLDKAAQQAGATDFVHADAAKRGAILAAWPKADPAFFKRFRGLVVGAYYTTQEGFKDIGYIGNVARTEDPGPSPEVKAHLERELKKLGL
jgi:hypothetical protein